MTASNPEHGGAQNRITSRFGFQQQAHAQRTQASSYYEHLDNLDSRLESQSVARIPRSRSSWGAEEHRLGSWGTGVGQMRQSGLGNAYSSGRGLPRIQQDRG